MMLFMLTRMSTCVPSVGPACQTLARMLYMLLEMKSGKTYGISLLGVHLIIVLDPEARLYESQVHLLWLQPFSSCRLLSWGVCDGVPARKWTRKTAAIVRDIDTVENTMIYGRLPLASLTGR